MSMFSCMLMYTVCVHIFKSKRGLGLGLEKTKNALRKTLEIALINNSSIVDDCAIIIIQ